MLNFCFSLQQLDNTAGLPAEAVTPTSILSACYPSDTISNVLDGSGSAAPADTALPQQVQKDVTAHRLNSICEESENNTTDPLPCQVKLGLRDTMLTASCGHGINTAADCRR